jgi:uncharacterized protein YjbI with pentapeptide repeats
MAEITDKPVLDQDETSRGAWTHRKLGGKTVWDWLQLLIVPIMLSLITIAFTWQQDIRQQRIEGSRGERARQLEEQRAHLIQVRLQRGLLGALLLDRDLHGADEDSDVRRLARARTLVVLDVLGPDRQNKVFRFLSETELIQAGTGDRPPIISLKYANLRGFELQGKQLLENTDLTQAKLYGADLSEAHLEVTDLSEAHLEEANLGGASLAGVSLSGAYLRDADLGGADLSGADLTDADGRFESGARMNGADLSGADLGGADLTNAEITRDQLQRAASLEGATLPDGRRYAR